jgi:adenylate cyclase
MGDTVNVASRLCGAAPGGKIWVTDAVFARVKDYFDVTELEPQSLKGKLKPVPVYEIVAVK